MGAIAEADTIDSPASRTSLVAMKFGSSANHDGVPEAFVDVDEVLAGVLDFFDVHVRAKPKDVVVMTAHRSGFELDESPWVTRSPWLDPGRSEVLRGRDPRGNQGSTDFGKGGELE